MIKNKSKLSILYIVLTYNNIFYILLNSEGMVLNWTTAGKFKHKGLKKLTAASVKNSLLHFRSWMNCRRTVCIKFKGTNKFKKVLLKYIKQLNLNIVQLIEETKTPHNGCKLKKKRYL